VIGVDVAEGLLQANELVGAEIFNGFRHLGSPGFFLLRGFLE